MQNNITNDLQIKVKEEYASLVPQQSDAEYQALKASISERGLIHAIIVTPQGYILDGHHRKKACDELGILPRYQVRDFKGDSALEKRFIVETNCIRRNLNLFQKIGMAYKAQPIYAELANRRRLAGLKHTKVSSSESSSVQKNTNDYEGRRVIDICAKRMGISASSYHMGRKILQSQVDPEVAIEYIIDKFSPKSGIVCDPILGYGNTAIAALKLGRQFIGWRMGSKTVETIQRRIESRDRSQLSWAA